MFKRLFTSAILFGLAATAPPVHGQSACAPREALIERLSDAYSEELVAGGLQNSQSVIEVWAAPETGTFSVLVSRADGMSCLVSSGTNYHQNGFSETVDDTPS